MNSLCQYFNTCLCIHKCIASTYKLTQIIQRIVIISVRSIIHIKRKRRGVLALPRYARHIR